MELREVNPRAVVASVVRFLRSPAASANLNPDASEGLEVAAQCLETAYALPNSHQDHPPGPELLDLYRAHNASTPAAATPITRTTATATFTAPFTAPAPTAAPQNPAEAMAAAFVATGTAGPFVVPGFSLGPQQPPVNPEVKLQADGLKNEGNALMKATKFPEALQKYTEAIALDPTNAIFFCNRAAAHSSMKNNEAAIEDCRRALSLNPKYGRAYGRLGLALTNLNRHAEAREAYKIACQLEPDNEAYRNNLAVTEETLSQSSTNTNFSAGVGVDLGSLLQNPTLANVATQMLSDPGLQNFMGRLLGDLSNAPPADAAAGSGGGLNILLQAGQQLAQQMQQANPELVEQLRQQMTNNQPQPPGTPNPPKPPPPNPPKPTE
ncbi:small glutamine-rich tetratricopeptide containing protein [Arctopsyche grandis]|uniref:small glutamine-rich tetratricopeptide containing protein n=1 Tax=Arctopsyche grandis TaxID=121162 RepID=UPI00406DA380